MEIHKKSPVNDEMKSYERASAGKPLSSELPIYMRIDGRGFSRFTKGLQRPFDPNFTRIMIETAEHLIKETNALAAYCQSDEISLLWLPRTEETPEAEAMFGGKPQKMCSVFAGMATARFLLGLMENEETREHANKLPHFDARVAQLPDTEAAAKMFAWRGADATRNAVSMFARSVFSHNQLMNKSVKTMRLMLEEKGTPFDAVQKENQNGTLILPRKRLVPIPEGVLRAIPARLRPKDGMGERTVHERFSEESPAKVENLVDVLFKKAYPLVKNVEKIEFNPMVPLEIF